MDMSKQTSKSHASKQSKYPVFLFTVPVVLILLVSGFLFFKWYSQPMTAPVERVVSYGGAYYSIIPQNDPVLAEVGLPHTISQNDIGNRTAYLTDTSGRCDFYDVSDAPSHAELLEYAAHPCPAIKILYNGSEYSFAVMGSYHTGDSENSPFSELFNLYGAGREEIESIRLLDRDKKSAEKSSPVITDPEAVAAFCSAAVSMQGYSFDEFHDLCFLPEMEAEVAEGRHQDGSEDYQVYQDYADSLRTLEIKLRDGIIFDITFSSQFGWVTVSELDTYYKISPSFDSWLQENNFAA